MSNPIALVTGVGRLQGIGRAICLELARKGCDIFFTYWSKYDDMMPWGRADDTTQIISEEIEALGVRSGYLELDLTNPDSANLLIQTVIEQLGYPSILINNATYSTASTIDSLNAAILDQHYNLNIKATTLLTLEFIKTFNYSSNGRVINLTSGQSLGQMSDEIAYAITKSAIENLTYTLSSEIAARGITINAVNPGPNDTGWIDERLKDVILERFPMGRVGLPSDTAKLVGFLCSEDAEWITGQIIHSEGGFVR